MAEEVQPRQAGGLVYLAKKQARVLNQQGGRWSSNASLRERRAPQAHPLSSSPSRPKVKNCPKPRCRHKLDKGSLQTAMQLKGTMDIRTHPQHQIKGRVVGAVRKDSLKEARRHSARGRRKWYVGPLLSNRLGVDRRNTTLSRKGNGHLPGKLNSRRASGMQMRKAKIWKKP